ncbi:SIR2 family protein [Candidatus Pacearchaeota archaeon]|nr:SIR2 family protein [Candidatus Pacearchaeota archaeon]
MSVLCRELVKTINTGRCFALIGAGPSCSVGFPDWKKLAEGAISKMDEGSHSKEVQGCKKLLIKGVYPEIFEVVSGVIGEKELLKYISSSFPKISKKGEIYEYLARWPFPCYLTTNYDDYLSEHLKGEGFTFVTKRNSQEEFRTLHAGAKNVIYKIHGDPTSPDNIVLTSSQYYDFQTNPSRRYWRNTILAALKMVRLVIVGYSAKDPNFIEQLEIAREMASPDRPIFMIAADVSKELIAKYFQEDSISIIPYKNIDGTHQRLKRLLRAYSPFIALRGSKNVGLPPVDEVEAELAASMYLFTQLRLSDNEKNCIEKAYQSLILKVLFDYGQEIELDELIKKLGETVYFKRTVDPIVLKDALESLNSGGFLGVLGGTKVCIGPNGQEVVLKIKEERKLIREKFMQACENFISNQYPDMKEDLVHQILDSIDKGLIQAFKKRGMEIAKFVFSNEQINVSDATDILDVVNKLCSQFPTEEQCLSCTDLIIEIITRPSSEMKDYLSFLAQGYFSYHALGLEPRCSKERLDMAKQKEWIFDSSILLPILAVGCLSHDYAKDLLNKMKALGLKCVISEKLFMEIIQHASWAIDGFQGLSIDDPKFLHAIIASPGFKQNLFIGGFIKWIQDKSSPSFHKYMCEALGEQYNDKNNLLNSIRSKIEELGISVVEFSEEYEFSGDDWSDLESIVGEIREKRYERGTFRNDEQCRTEAEVVVAMKKRDGIFLSQSTILNVINSCLSKTSWKPEMMYRFLSMFSIMPTESDLLYECMTQDLFQAGFNIVDKEVISQYIDPFVRQARMNINEAKEQYTNILGKQRMAELEEGFERTPDEQKPFYSVQFAFYVAKKQEEGRRLAENRADEVVMVKELTGAERKEFAKLKTKKEEKERKRLLKQKKGKKAAKKKKKKKKKK